MSSNLKRHLSFARRMILRRRILKRGVYNFIRNSWLSLAAVIVMAFTLFTVFMAGSATLILNGTVENIKSERANLSLYFNAGTKENEWSAVKTELEGDSNVVSVDVCDSACFANKIKSSDNVDTNLVNSTDLNLAERTPIVFTIKVANLDNLDSVTKIVNDDRYMSLHDDPGLQKNQFYENDKQNATNVIRGWAENIQLSGLILGGVFLVITILVIFNTIRMAIFARRDEIEMEKLIGAEKSYIRGPFLVEAELYGLFAGAIALGLGYAIVTGIMPWLNNNGLGTDELTHVLFNFPYMLVVIFGMIFVGYLIGYISARLAVHKYLRD